MANIIKSVAKSIGSSLLSYSNDSIFYPANFNDSYLQFMSENHTFKIHSIDYLITTGYQMNPVVFGIINKILLSQQNLSFIPYRNGKPYKSGQLELDQKECLAELLLTGTLVIYKKELIGFPTEHVILPRQRLTEQLIGDKFRYYYKEIGGKYTIYEEDELIFITVYKPKNTYTNFGIAPLQAAIMPLDAMKEMYTADTALLKNKGADILISSASDEAMQRIDQDTFDESMNDRIKGARKTGKAITTTKNVNVTQLGRTVKELALWDGYKIKLRDICTALQTDSAIFGDPDNKKFSNVSEADKALYTSCTIPYSNLIFKNKELTKSLGFDVWVDSSDVECLQTSQKEKQEKNKVTTDAIVNLNKDVQNGSITKEIAVRLLVNEWGYDEQEALLVIQDYKEPKNTTQDENNE